MPCRLGAHWTESEDSILRQHWPDTRKIAELTSRTPGAVYSRGYLFGLKNPAIDRYASTAETIVTLWQAGHTATQIAKQVGVKTRAAILGKLNRLGLLGKRPKVCKSPVSPQEKRRRNKEATRRYRSKFNFARAITPRAMAAGLTDGISGAPPSLNIPLVDLEPRHCRWPIGDPKQPDFAFCGHKPHPGLPYCCHHARIAYQVRP